jgi:hypothetical protein
MTIALLGDPDDLAITYISWLAGRRQIETVLAPEATLGVDWRFSLDSQSGERLLRVGSCALDLDALDGIFVRLSPQPPLPDGLSLDPAAQALFTHERREGLHHLLQTVKCPVVNRPSGGRANASKPLQMSQLRDAGFTVPRWVVTNCADAATAFAGRSPGDVIYKATSGLRSRVRRVDDQLRERLAAGTTPTVIQEYIPGRDVRVHTVGDRAFATEMVSDGVDYRFVPTTEYRPATVRTELADRCCETARIEGLMLAGFGEPIGDAVLDLFTADRGRRTASLAEGVCAPLEAHSQPTALTRSAFRS